APGAEVNAAARPDHRQRLLQAHELRVVVIGLLADHLAFHWEDALNDCHIEALRRHARCPVDIRELAVQRAQSMPHAMRCSKRNAQICQTLTHRMPCLQSCTGLVFSYAGLEIARKAWKF